MLMLPVAALSVLLLGARVVASAATLDAMFSTGAVLQMGRPVPVWGSAAAPHQDVSVSLDGTIVATGVAKADGSWAATLPPQPAAYNRTLSVAGSASTISFGVVLLCSGQSNMAMGVGGAGAFHKPGKPPFSADNGTVESAASGRFTGKIWFREDTNDTYVGPKRRWMPVAPHTLPGLSAVCWYSGKAIFLGALEAAGTPLGLLVATWGATPIEYWLPQSDPANPNVNSCESDQPQCVSKFPQLGPVNDSAFFARYVQPLAPYAVAGLVWDQAERDVKCPRSLVHYSCMQSLLIRSWRRAFDSEFVFVGVQLAGYTGIDNGGPRDPEKPFPMISAHKVFEMRLQQASGCEGVAGKCSVVPTYDLSCAAGLEGGCPFGSVHQPHKAVIGERIGRQLLQAGLGGVVAARQMVVATGPRPTRAHAIASGAPAAGAYTVTVFFSGGSSPFYLQGTRNCTTCCTGSVAGGSTVDLDASADGVTFVNTTNLTLTLEGTAVTFVIQGLHSAPTVVRHTASAIFPQCALYNREQLPAVPFVLNITQDTAGRSRR